MVSIDPNELYLDQLIGNQERAIRYYVFFAVGLACLGIGVMVFAALISSRILADAFKALFGLGGAFVSSLSAIQIKEILLRREKIGTFQLLKSRLDETPEGVDAGEDEDQEIQDKIDELLWQIVEKTALS
jgi:hypothetical protein